MFEWQPVWLSIKVALASLGFVVLLGVSAAYVMRRSEFAGKAAVEAVFSLPLVLPPVVTGFLLLLLIGKQGPFGRFLADSFDLAGLAEIARHQQHLAWKTLAQLLQRSAAPGAEGQAMARREQFLRALENVRSRLDEQPRAVPVADSRGHCEDGQIVGPPSVRRRAASKQRSCL